ncbi:hypothetical protein ABZ543_08320 [Streptomyces roseifaciens]
MSGHHHTAADPAPGRPTPPDPDTGRKHRVYGDDPDSILPANTRCAAVRITTPDADGNADHGHARTYHFGQPVTFQYLRRRSPASQRGMPTVRSDDLPGLAAFTAPYDHPQIANFQALTHDLGLLRGKVVTVEGWSRPAGGRWLYLHVPRWQHDEEDWAPEEPGSCTQAVGWAMPAPRACRWPSPSSTPGHYDIEAGTQLFLTTDAGPPPPPTTTGP